MYIRIRVKYFLVLSDFNETSIFLLIFEKSSNIRFHENPLKGSRVSWGRTDGHHEGNSRFSQILRTRLKQSCAHPHEFHGEAETSSIIWHCAVLHCASSGKSTERPYIAQCSTAHCTCWSSPHFVSQPLLPVRYISSNMRSIKSRKPSLPSGLFFFSQFGMDKVKPKLPNILEIPTA